jgi:hypothetical protein
MFSSGINIEFIAATPEILDIAEKPLLASRNQPEWFSKTPRYVHGERDVDHFNDPTSTIKKCMPVVDMMFAGYHIPLPSDVWLENAGENNLSFKWSWDLGDVVSLQKPDQHQLYPVPLGCYPSVFKWINPWIVKTPPGWSCLFIHPQHHEELPFRCLSALVDTDKHPAPVNFPFFLRKGFNGLIPQNTPIIQVIPFKREKYTSTFDWDKKSIFKKTWDKAHAVFFDRYARFFRSRKDFEAPTPKKTKGCPFGFGG